MKHSNLKLALLILLVVVFQNIFSQRPKVGLVLSGGGAKGLAHVGILKAIDSAGLKIDYITGTSMGSIVGGMYAAGYSGKQIEVLNNSIFWPDMFNGKPKYQSVSIEERDDYDNYVFEVPFKHFRPTISTGLIESEEVYLYFNKVYFPFYGSKDFTKFDIPFKCVATNLTDGKAVVLYKGEIVKAVRASMAIPGVFESILEDSVKLVDGGIIRNFPVSDCVDLGADYIIGVNLFPGLSKANELNDALDVMYQITQYRDAEDLVTQKKYCNLLIEPPLKEFNAGSFSDSKVIESIGNEIGKAYYPIFKHLADSLNALEYIPFDPTTRFVGEYFVVIDSIVSTGRVKTTNRMLRQQLGIKIGKSYSAKDLEYAFRNAYSSLYYKTLYYELLPTTSGHAILKVIVRENELNVVKIGLGYQSFNNAALILNFTRRNLFFDKSRSMVKLALGHNIRILGQHKQFFGRNLNDNVSIESTYDYIDYPLYLNDKVGFLYTTNKVTSTLSYTHEFGLKRSLSIGTTWDFIYFRPEIAPLTRYRGTNQNLYSYLNYSVNTLERKFFPCSGHLGFLEGGIYSNNISHITQINDGANESTAVAISKKPFVRLKASLDNYFAVTPSVTILQNVQGTLSLDDNTFYFQNSFLGGVHSVIPNQLPFVGYQETQINTNSFVSTMLGLQIKTFGELYTILRGNIGVTEFYSQERWFSKKYQRFRSGASIGIGYNLASFPVELNLMYSPELRNVTTHVSLGFTF